MKFSLAVAFTALAYTVSASDILTLTDADFAEKTKDVEVALAEFYAPWCGHCKKLAPEFEVAATKLIKNDPPVTLIQVSGSCTLFTIFEFRICNFNSKHLQIIQSKSDCFRLTAQLKKRPARNTVLAATQRSRSSATVSSPATMTDPDRLTASSR